jgi:phenylacetate-CoA ligase
MRRMEKITGRADDMLIIRGVNVFPTQIEEQILKLESLAPHYLIEVHREGRLDSMTVHVEARAEGASPEARAAAAQALASAVKNIVGISIKPLVTDPGAIERSIGKARRVVDHRPKD